MAPSQQRQILEISTVLQPCLQLYHVKLTDTLHLYMSAILGCIADVGHS